MILTIDTGTTNTRVYLVDGETIKGSVKVHAGAGDTAKTGSNQFLKDSLRSEINKLLTDHNVAEGDLRAVYASGMITSELGLCEVPHLTAPVTPQMLCQHAKTVLIDDVVSVPITFIPGVKNNADYACAAKIHEMDMMRGEETELFGLMHLLKPKLPFTAILPGSHTKFVTVGKEGKILSCHTTLGGELLAAISRHTILNSSLSDPLITEVLPDSLRAGFTYCKQYGLSDAAFRVRLADRFTGATENERANFLAGAVLASDIQALHQAAPETAVLVGGSDPLRSIFFHLINIDTHREVFAANDEAAELATVFGVLKIFTNRGERENEKNNFC